MAKPQKTVEAMAEAQRLRDSGMTWRAVAEHFGVSRSTVIRWLNPAYEERGLVHSRRNKERYRGVCESCGGPTSGCNGPGRAAPLCLACFNAARRPEHGTLSRYRSGCSCDSCREANRLHVRSLIGKPPPSHGLSGYLNYRCRCRICRKAGAEKNALNYAVRQKRAM